MSNSESSWSEGPGGDLFKAAGMGDSALELLWPGTRAELERRQLQILDSIAHGVGASAVVIIARDLVAKRRVAVKIYIDPTAQGNVERFKIEARVLSSDTLPAGLVPLLYACHEGSQLTAGAPSQPFLVMEYIEGLKIVDYARENKLSVARRIQLTGELFHQLKLLHECNLVHGDLSKNNVLGRSGDAVRLIDFGSARRRNSAIASSISLSGPAGTLRFAPEDVLTGKAKADATSDVFGAAAIAFLLLTDEVYDDKKLTLDAARQQLVRAGAPAAIADLIVRGLRQGEPAKGEADARFKSATEVVAELERWRLSYDRRRRLRQQALLVTPLLLSLVAVAAWAWWQVGELRRTQSEHEVSMLEQELAGLTNREHPAIRDALKRANEERAVIRQLELTGDSREATMRRQQLADRLRHIRDVSHRIERLVPVRLAYGEQLHKWPWIKAAPTIQAELKKISEQYAAIGQRLDAGDVDEAGRQLAEFVRQLARLVEANVAAGGAEKSRSVYTHEELSVSERVRNHEGFASVRKLAISASKAWEAGQFSEADKLFGHARQIMDDVLPKIEDSKEKEQRETKLATGLRKEVERLTQEVRELRGEKNSFGEKVRSLEGQIVQVTGQGANDREALKVAQLEVEALKAKNKAGSGLLQQLRDQIAILEPKAKQCDTMHQAHGRLVSDLAKLKGERDDLQRKLTNAQQQVSMLSATTSRNSGIANEADLESRAKKPPEEFDTLKTTGPIDADRGVTPRLPGDRMVVDLGEIELSFRWCPGGTAKIGSPPIETNHSSDEDQVEVTLAGFYMAETEFTQRQFEVVTGRPPDARGDFGKGPYYPVYNVTYDDCLECAEQATALALKRKTIPATARIVLPTEAQWEYATRAGTTYAYSFGSDESQLGKYAWFEGNSNGMSHPVGQKRPNPWGLYDVHGNVWERVSDWYSEKLTGGKEPCGPLDGSYRVNRGGGWDFPAKRCRSANRDGYLPDFRNNRFLGFRVALIVSGQESSGGTR